MIAQLVFFAALALFLVIILRRVTLSKDWLIQLWQGIKNGLFVLFSGFSRLLGRRQRQPKANVANSTNSNGQSLPTSVDNFWKEEPVEEKPELLSHFEEGDEMLRTGKLDQAEKFFLTAATRNPKDARVYAKLGLVYLTKKNYVDAVEALKVAVKQDKYNPSRHYNLALAYWGNKDGQRAISTIREAISLDPVTKKYRIFLEQLLNKK